MDVLPLVSENNIYTLFMITKVFKLVRHRKYSSVSFMEFILGEDFLQVIFHSQFLVHLLFNKQPTEYPLKIHTLQKSKILKKKKKKLEFRIFEYFFLG